MYRKAFIRSPSSPMKEAQPIEEDLLMSHNVGTYDSAAMFRRIRVSVKDIRLTTKSLLSRITLTVRASPPALTHSSVF